MMTAHCALFGERELSVIHEIKTAIATGESFSKKDGHYTAKGLDLTLSSGHIYQVTTGLVTIQNSQGVTIARYNVDNRVPEAAIQSVRAVLS